jgi:hypothetical protein
VRPSMRRSPGGVGFLADEPGGGYVIQLPMPFNEGIESPMLVGSFFPWGSPSFLSLVGHVSNDPSRTKIVIAYEVPIQWGRHGGFADKREMESTHAHSFRTQQLLAGKGLAFGNVREGSDPPDLLVDTPTGAMGLECTRLAISARQGAHGLFSAVRQRIEAAPPEDFSSLAGYIVYMWFNEQDAALTLPFRRSDADAVEALVRALAEYHPDPHVLWSDEESGLENAPNPPTHTTDAGASFYAVPLRRGVPSTNLFARTGFELGLAFTTDHLIDEVWQQLQDHILRKDKPGTDWLLISAGAPDVTGNIYLAEDTIAEALIKNPPTGFPVLQHLKRVTLHGWATGWAVDIFPTARRLFGPIYGDVVPISQQIETYQPDAGSLEIESPDPQTG